MSFEGLSIREVKEPKQPTPPKHPQQVLQTEGPFSKEEEEMLRKALSILEPNLPTKK